MNRRAFVTGLGLVLTAPLAVEAQQPRKMSHIGVLAAGSPTMYSARYEAFRRGLRELGYVEGRPSPSSTGMPRRSSSDCPTLLPSWSASTSTSFLRPRLRRRVRRSERRRPFPLSSGSMVIQSGPATSPASLDQAATLLGWQRWRQS